MTGGYFTVHPGVVRQHSNDVAVVEKEFSTGTSGILTESIATDVAFGLMWAPIVVPPLTAAETALGLLCDKVGNGLHDLATRIDATADVYDKGEATNKALVERAKPDLTGTGDVLTNDTQLNLLKDVATGKPIKPEDVVIGDAGFLNNGYNYGVTLGKLATGQEVDPIDVVKLFGNIFFDALGFALNPLGSLVGPFVGLIIDAIPPLKELVDITLGDPDAIGKVSKSWDTLAKWFVDTGDDYQESLKQVTDAIWSGEAADKYRETATNSIAALGNIGQDCEIISGVVLSVGSIVSYARGKIISLITGFVIEQAIALAAASATAGPTFGGSVAAFWAEFEVDAEIKSLQAGLAIEQAIMNLVLTIEKAIEQQIKFSQYAAKLSS
ncbi:MAG TPA: hypothetical protein VGL21_09260 [Jatrophihabitantaceae bacterium]|jgi:hypothetical protein